MPRVIRRTAANNAARANVNRADNANNTARANVNMAEEVPVAADAVANVHVIHDAQPDIVMEAPAHHWEVPEWLEDDRDDNHNEDDEFENEVNDFISNVTIGADPELFIYNYKTNKVVSSIGIIPGEKGKPWVDPNWEKGYGLEIDNILGEFNIPPAHSEKEFVSSINFMKDYIDKFVKKVNPDLGIMCKASAHVDEDQLNNEIAKLFGCSVDYNVYSGGPNPKPAGEKTNLRSTGRMSA